MARGGARPNSGRKRGESKATIERRALAERILEEQRQGSQPGKKLAREVLDDLMHLCLQYAAVHQPLPKGVLPGPQQDPNEGKFIEYAKLAGEFAGKLVKFQSPSFKSVEVRVEPLPGGALGPPASGEGARLSQMTPQQAYRMLRDADVIDMPSRAPAPAKKAAGG